jgi:hypothetical protein
MAKMEKGIFVCFSGKIGDVVGNILNRQKPACSDGLEELFFRQLYTYWDRWEFVLMTWETLTSLFCKRLRLYLLKCRLVRVA